MAENLNPNIFLSYAWANTNIADEIDNDFKSIGIQFKRDVRDLEYRKSIKEFMQQVGKSDFVLMIISDEYLRSENCMYEVTELLNTHELEKRILPIVIDNAKAIFKPLNQQRYYEYWTEKKKEADKFKRKHANEVSIEYAKKCGNIQGNLPAFFQIVTDLNASSYHDLKGTNYRDLLRIIGFSQQRLLEEAIRIWNVDDKEERELELEDFLKKHPDNKYGLFQKAYLFADAKQFKKARKYYEDLVKVAPNDHSAHYNLALLISKNFHDYDGAKEHYEIAIKIHPNYNQARYNLANLLEKHFLDYHGAKQHYEDAIKFDPNDIQGHNNFAILLENHFHDFDGAKRQYETALKIDPNADKVHNNLGSLLAKHFLDYSGAKKHYKMALKINADYGHAHNNLGGLLISHFRDVNGAKWHFEKAIAIEPSNEAAQKNLKKLLEKHFKK